jgi:hypothetical protein
MRPEVDPQVLDTKIQAKINAVHRGAFIEKFPGQVEHILRLITERLQHGLDKREGVDVSRVDTWRLSPYEIAELSQALYHINEVRNSLKE